MAITLNLTPEQEAQLSGEAARLGLTLEEYALDRLLSAPARAGTLDLSGKDPTRSGQVFELRAAELPEPEVAALSEEAERHHKAGRSAEEYRALERLLSALPPHDSTTRCETVARLMIAAYACGQNSWALEWAKQVLAADSDPTRRYSAYRMAGIAANGLGFNQDADRYYLDGYEAAMSDGRLEDAAKCLLLRADVQNQEGEPVGALETSDRVMEIWPDAARSACTLKAEALAFLGRYEESIDAYKSAIKAAGHGVPMGDDRSKAIITVGLARTYCQLRRAPDARLALNDAMQVLRGDDKLALWCDAADCWLLALEGAIGDSQSKVIDVLARRVSYSEDRNTEIACLGDAARATAEMKLHEQAVELGRLYIAERPTKADRPFMLVLIGESELALGRTEQAVEAFREAAAGPEQVYHTSVAAERLKQLT
jgi:tetratricopeptide (TPR) repeat protein